MVSFVSLFDASKGYYVKEARYTLPPMEAMIAAVEQYKGNYNTWEYPKKLDGVRKSNFVKGRLLYDLTENLILESQPA